MIGAIVGDVVGSRFEFQNTDTKKFDLFTFDNRYTDDSVMLCAAAKTLTLAGCNGDREWRKLTPKFITKVMQYVGQDYPRCGYGGRFINWMYSDNPVPYNSCGNGSAMRIAPVGFVAKTEEECKELSRKLTEVSHDHPEGLKGAECTAMCIFLARQGKSKEEIRRYVQENYYDISELTVDKSREFNGGEHGKEICQVAVPQALVCFFESTGFEDCIRNCVSIGGDTDTVGAIAGGIAEAFYGVPSNIADLATLFLDRDLRRIYLDFEAMYHTDNII